MKFLLDASISPRVIPALIASGHQATMANDGLAQTAWQAWQKR